MAITKRYTEQIVVMTTEEQANALKSVSEEYGVSVAQVARDAAALGLPKLAARYDSLGITKPGASGANGVAKARGDEAARAERKSTKSRAKRVPAAVFSAPAE